MLSNAYFLAKFRFDTAENEPAKNLQKNANFADPNPLTLTLRPMYSAPMTTAMPTYGASIGYGSSYPTTAYGGYGGYGATTAYGASYPAATTMAAPGTPIA